MTEASQKVQAWLEGPPPRSQAALARLAEIPATTVRNVLAGHGATAMTIEKLRSVRGLGDLQAKHFTNGRAA